ncbi:MAG: DEAD/DEAH box helicase, partial [Candidatus Nanopelagicaceae bacterium]
GKFLPELSIRAYARAEKVGETIEIDDAEEDLSDGDRTTKRRREPVVIKFENDVRKFTARMIGGCEVKFPEGLSPHPAQMMTMSSIIRALSKGEHAMIESPTGTGKTLAILCAALAWQEKYGGQVAAENFSVAENREKYEKARIEYLQKKGDPKGENPTIVRGDGWSAADPYFKGAETTRSRIFICSRTHSQLNQVLRELKRTGYSPRYTVLSSRQRMCQLNKNDAECKQLIGSSEDEKKNGSTACPYYNRHRHVVSTMGKYANAGRAGKFPQAWDMEDFERVVDEVEGCSFFALREMYKDADIVFCPYNYLFDVNIRRKMSIEIENACVIIDEGHNLEDVCREGSSMEISLEAIGQAADQLAKNHGSINAETNTIAQFFNSISGFFENIFRMNSVKEDVVKSNQVQDFIEGMFSQCTYEL